MSISAWGNVLIQTKFHRPAIPNDLVARPHLFDWLDQHCQRSLILVSAPAGYGKSTLISGWLDRSAMPSAWISLDERDNDLNNFLSYFITAIQGIYPGTLVETQALLQAPDLPPPRFINSTLINELNAIGKNYALVLDDYHLIQKIAIHNLIDELLRFPPYGLHLVIGTRTDPLLSLVDLRAHQQLAEIRGQDLRFSMQETKQLLHNLLGREIEEEIALSLEEKSEGWVTGLRLAALALRHRKGHLTIEGDLTANNRFVRDYLTTEILGSQTPAFSENLQKISVLDRFCAGLYQAVCGSDDETKQVQFHPGKFMDWLYASNLFVIPLDDEGYWVRFHHLFREFLREHLNQRFTKSEIADLHTRASSWFAQQGLIDEAINHALLAGDPLHAAQVLEQNARDLLDRDLWHTLEISLAKLPEDIIQHSPQLLLAKAWILFHQYKMLSIFPILQKIEPQLEQNETDQPLLGEVDFFKGNHWFWQGKISRSLELLESSLEKIPKTHHLARGEAELLWGLASQMSNQAELAIKKLNSWLYDQQVPHPGRQTKIEGAIIFIHLLSGNLLEADAFAKQLYQLATRNNNAYVKNWVAYLRGMLSLFWNDLENAYHFFTEAVKNRYILHAAAAVQSMAGLIFTAQTLGNSEQAERTMTLLLEFAYEKNDPYFISTARSCQSRLALLKGDTAAAAHWQGIVDLEHDASLMFLWLEVPRITQCRVLINRGSRNNLQEAAEKLATYRELTQTQSNILQLIQILVLESLTFFKLSRTDDALSALRGAITLAEPGGWIWPFLEPGPELIPLISRMVDLEGETKYTRKILALCKSGQDAESDLPATSPPALIEPLTNREFEVLELLVKRMTNKEIANKLHISVGTVEQHLNHIYAKLDVKGRRQAAARAADLAMISFRE